MAAVTICNEVIGPDAMILVFWMLSFKLGFSLFSFTSSRASLVPLHFLPLGCCHLHIWGYWYFSWQFWFQLVLHPAQYFSWYTLHLLNKHSDNRQPWCTPFPIWNQSVVPCPVLTVASDLHTDFSGSRSSGLIFPSLKEFSTVYCDPHSQRFGIVNKAEVDVFLELLCFFSDPADVGNLISGSSAFSKSNLNIWKFTVNMLLKPGLENFEHYFASIWNESIVQ